MKILLIEDDQHDVMAFQSRFRDCDITVARTAAEAIKEVDDRFALIVADVMVPGAIDNWLIDLLRAGGHEDRLIVISGLPRSPDVLRKNKTGYQAIRDRVESIKHNTNPTAGRHELPAESVEGEG